ncbi:hypothetical protein PENTCL1PPCAC_28638, partial [Pristionchus entomophagus]
ERSRRCERGRRRDSIRSVENNTPTMPCFRARCNSLGSIWYTLIVIGLQAYLIYLGVERYKLYNDMKWPTGGYPSAHLTVYSALYMACLPLLVVLFAVGVFKSGNIAGDNERLADREGRTLECRPNRKGNKDGCLHAFKSLWQHSPPFPQQIHVLIAIIQCVAQQLMIAQMYKHGFVTSTEFLNTEMDFLFHRSRQLGTNLPSGETRLQGFQITKEELNGAPLGPPLLPLLMHIRLFGISLEFVNLVLALVAYSIAYPSVFWRVSKFFSLLFSSHLLINSICLVFSYLAFSVLYRIQETNIDSVRPVGYGQYLVSLRQFSYLYHPLGIIVAFVGSTILTQIAPITLYAYGYNKYLINVLNCQAKNNVRNQGTSAGQSEYSTYNRGRTFRPTHSQLCCDGYGPHVVAIALLAVICILKAPIIYALMIIYQNDDRALLLVCISTEITYLFSWILLWIGLTLKREWNFNILHRAHELYALQKGLTSGHVRVNTNPSQLKNALIVVHRDHMFVTDDQTAKQSLLRNIQQNNFEQKDETYWLKTNGGTIQGSPAMKRMHSDSGRTEEMNRLLSGGGTLRRQSNQQQQAVQIQEDIYTTRMPPGMHPSQLTTPGYRGGSSPPQGTDGFGTLTRQQQQYTLQRHASAGVNPTGTLQRSLMGSKEIGWAGPVSGREREIGWAEPVSSKERGWSNGPTESYASIHKSKELPGPGNYVRRGSQDEGSGFSAPSAYGTVGNYATYSRLPPQQSRLANLPNGGSSTLRLNNSAYASQQQIGMPRPPQTVTIPSIRQSPLIGERAGSAPRDQPAYGRVPAPSSGVKLSSFNLTGDKTAYGSVGGFGSSQRVPVGQPSQLLYNGGGGSTTAMGPKAVPPPSLNATTPLSNSSSAQDATGGCFTPNSTVTSQGSNYSQRTPRGSPQHQTSSFGGPRSDIHRAEVEEFEDGTLQRAPPKPAIVTGSTSVRHTVKVVGSNTLRSNEDSANYSQASSNGSGATANDYATSVV